MAVLLAAAFSIAGLVLGARHQDGAVAATTPTMTQPPSSTPTSGAPLTPGLGATGRPLVAPAVYASHHGVLNVTPGDVGEAREHRRAPGAGQGLQRPAATPTTSSSR